MNSIQEAKIEELRLLVVSLMIARAYAQDVHYNYDRRANFAA